MLIKWPVTVQADQHIVPLAEAIKWLDMAPAAAIAESLNPAGRNRPVARALHMAAHAVPTALDIREDIRCKLN